MASNGLYSGEFEVSRFADDASEGFKALLVVGFAAVLFFADVAEIVLFVDRLDEFENV